MIVFLRILPVIFFAFSCGPGTPKPEQIADAMVNPPQARKIVNPEGTTVATRFQSPSGFRRLEVLPGSFAQYLRDLPLKPDGSDVLFYNGELKASGNHAAVIDMDVGHRDLQQCADAIMRIRAEYFFNRREYDSISFNFVNGFKAAYTRWAQGERIGIKGNRAFWYSVKGRDFSYQTFREYLRMVYSYAGTASLEKELKPKDYRNISIGDVYIHGGSPGHAMLVMDVVVDEKGSKAFILAQSFMPAQSFHVVRNTENEIISPWYIMDEIERTLVTPSWNFYKAELYSF